MKEVICAPYDDLRIGRSSSSKSGSCQLVTCGRKPRKAIVGILNSLYRSCIAAESPEMEKAVRTHCPRGLFKLKVFDSHV